MRLPLLLLSGCFSATALRAQEIPPYVPANPLLESRSALYSQPFVHATTGWQVRWLNDYYNAVEAAQVDQRQMIFDAEVLQSDLWVTKSVTPRIFVFGNVAVRGAYDGFLDKFLIDYHHFIGLPVPARDELPRNTFNWTIGFPDTLVVRKRPGTFLGDSRFGAGWRLGAAELVASVTLPTGSIGDDGWTRHVPATSLALVAEPLHGSRMIVDASVSAGFTPTQGALARYQRSVFAAGMIGARWRFAGQQALFGTLWAQSPNWHDTGLLGVDDAEVVGDFGLLLRIGRRMPELQVGITEDIVPKGPAMDVGFTFGVRW